MLSNIILNTFDGVRLIAALENTYLPHFDFYRNFNEYHCSKETVAHYQSINRKENLR